MSVAGWPECQVEHREESSYRTPPVSFRTGVKSENGVKSRVSGGQGEVRHDQEEERESGLDIGVLPNLAGITRGFEKGLKDVQIVVVHG